MENNNLKIGETIRRIRKDMKLSLTMAADRTGVSKAMLGQIERGESNPTISTLWKISSGLRVSMSTFVSSGEAKSNVIDVAEIQPVNEANGQMLLYNIFPFDPVSGFDYLKVILKPECRHESEPHANVATEYILVIEGRMDLTVNEEVTRLEAGQAMAFPGRSYHVYTNISDGETVFYNIMRYI